MKEEWLLNGAVVPVDTETTVALVAEIKRLIDVIGGMALAQQEPVLQDIEQYRLQMAAICTAALGYWEEDDGIRPDYDTLAFRDVAALYAKYDALYKAQPAQEPWRESASDYERGFIDGAQKQAQSSVDKAVNRMAQRPWVYLTDNHIKEIVGPYGNMPIKGYTRELFDRIEAKSKELNT